MANNHVEQDEIELFDDNIELGLVIENTLDKENNSISNPDKSDSYTRSEIQSIDDEKSLFKQETPRQERLNESHNIFKHVFLNLGGKLIMYIGASIIVLELSSEKATSIENLIMYLIAFNGVVLFINLVQSCLQRDQKVKYFYRYRFLNNICKVCFYYGFMLYLQDEFNIKKVTYFLIPKIILCILAFCGTRRNIFFINGFFLLDVWDLVQTLFIISFWEKDSYWAKFLIYILQGIMYQLISYMFIVVSTAAILILLLNRNNNNLNNDNKMLISLAIPLAFYVMWYCNQYLYVVKQVTKLINWHYLNPDNDRPVINEDLHQISIAFLCCSSVNLLLLVICFSFVNKYFILVKRRFRSKEISLATYGKELRLRVKRISQTFFKFTNKSSYKELDEEKGNSFDEQLCYICYSDKNEIIIEPCGHSGICNDCFVDYLKSKNKCPICKQEFKTAFRAQYNKKKGGFYAKQIFKIN